LAKKDKGLIGKMLSYREEGRNKWEGNGGGNDRMNDTIHRYLDRFTPRQSPPALTNSPRIWVRVTATWSGVGGGGGFQPGEV